VRVYEKVLIHVLKQRETKRPSISEMCAAGSLLGLGESDIRRLGRFNMTSRLKDFLARSFLLFLFSLLAVVAIALVLSWLLSNSYRSVMTPYYAVGFKTLFKDRLFPF
jgi:hypothetical protein